MITVTKAYLPDYKEYEKYLKRIWESGWLTNHGPLVRELEEKLKAYLGVKHCIYTNNGTIALQIAIKALDLKREIITTPFSYVATTNSILWEGCTPVFADINETDFNINPDKIIPLINKNTSAIMATHVYGNPCDVEAIEKIAADYGLKVIYDGAHAFGTTLNNKQVLSFGDIATCSFHATKIFHTIEGGAIITNDDDLAEKITLYRQFGHFGDDYFSLGINGKNSEFHAAMGLCLFPMINQFIEKRKEIAAKYDELLINLPLQRPQSLTGTTYNYSYHPVVFNSVKTMIAARDLLQQNNINTRRYFYPSLNNLPQFKGESCPVSESISSRVLALPMYYDLADEDVTKIGRLIKTSVE